MQIEESFDEKCCHINDQSTADGKNIDTIVQKALQNIIITEGYQTYAVNKKLFTATGDSFVGVLCELNIKGETANGRNETNVFMKIMHPDQHMTYFDMSYAYFKEWFTYNELYKVYADLQEEYKVPLEERFSMVQCYDGGSKEVIALENMRLKGYATMHRTEIPSLDYVEKALKELAKFHALSFALENKNPIYFKNNIQTIKGSLVINDEWDSLNKNLIDVSVKLLNEDVKLRMNAFIKEFTNKFQMCMEDKNTFRCLCHGDYRTSNILMKRVDGKILKIIPIDYQIILYCSPVTDFLYFMYTSTDREFRTNHISHLKDLYYNTFKNFLDYFNIGVEKVYSREDFEKTMKDKLDFGLMISLLMLPILLSTEDVEPDLSKLGENAVEIKTNDQCKKRVAEVVEEFIELGYL